MPLGGAALTLNGRGAAKFRKSILLREPSEHEFSGIRDPAGLKEHKILSRVCICVSLGKFWIARYGLRKLRFASKRGVEKDLKDEIWVNHGAQVVYRGCQKVEKI